MSTPTITVNLGVTAQGFQPTSPATIYANYISYLTAIDPGYTVLPGLLIEDLSSTATGALIQIDNLCVELGNSISPYNANPWILTQLGNVYGVVPDLSSNTSVFVTFSGTVGFVIQPGFTVGDGTHQYVVQDGGSIATGGASSPLFCVATVTGSWAVPIGTVTTLITSVPGGITLTCTNASTGTPGIAAQSLEDYQLQVIESGKSVAQGMPTFLRSNLRNVPGVQHRLISIVQINGGGWEVIVGGGDPYQVAYAIYASLFDIASLVGSTIGITAITKANPGVVTTNLNHGLTNGQNNVHIAGVLGMTQANGGPYTVTVITPTTFSFGVDTTGFGTYTSGGVVTPNNRNLAVNIIDSPNTYTVNFVIPPQETVVIQLTWNTTSPNFVSATAVSQLGGPAIVNYVNSISVGQPINQFDMEVAFSNAIASLVPIQYLSKMSWTVTINGVVTSPTNFLYNGDPESYFFMTIANVTVTQG